jgi:hypothetical protein
VRPARVRIDSSRFESMERWLRQLALRASVGGGFLATLVTPSGRLWRPNRPEPICRASVEPPTRGFSVRRWKLFSCIFQFELDHRTRISQLVNKQLVGDLFQPAADFFERFVKAALLC